MNRIYKLNIITIIFICAIIGSILQNYLIIYIPLGICFVYLLYKLINLKIKKNSFNKIYSLILASIVIIMFTSTMLSLIYNNQPKRVIEICLFIISISLGIQIRLLYGNSYIKKGLLNINNIMVFINIYGIIEFMSKSNIIYDLTLRGLPTPKYAYRTMTVFLHPIVYANVLLIIFWVNLLLNENKKFSRMNTVLILFNIYATQSRSSWIALFVTIIIYLISKIKVSLDIKLKQKDVVKFIIITIIIILFIKSSYGEGIINSIMSRFSQLNSSEGSVSASQRIGSISYIIEQVYNSSIIGAFFGHGYGMSSKVINEVTISIANFSTVDNQYIGILWDFGIIGLIMKLGLIVAILYRTINLNCIKKCTCINIIFFSIVIPMFFYNCYGWPIISLLYFFILGSLCIKDSI